MWILMLVWLGLLIDCSNSNLVVLLHYLLIFLLFSSFSLLLFEIANENAGNNNTYTIPIDIPKGEHMMTVYAHNPIGWSTNNQDQAPQKLAGKSQF